MTTTDVTGYAHPATRSQGQDVEAASRGADALDLFRPGKFNLIITQLAMPEMT